MPDSSLHTEYASFRDDFLAAYEAHADALFRFCLAKTSNREVALDLTQDTFTRTWDYLARGRTVESMKAFLFTVARNAITDYYKKKRAIPLSRFDDPETGAPLSIEDTHADILEDMYGAEAFRAVAKLPDAYREVVMLRYAEGLPVQEIAEILGEKENTVSVRIKRALVKLEDALTKTKHE